MFRNHKIIHALLIVVFVLATIIPVAYAAPASARPAGNTIVDIAVKNGGFTTLVAAVSCTGLVPALSGQRQYTVFAPTDAAFSNLGLNASNVCSIPKATLTNILLYHVAHGARYASDVVASDRIRMLNGEFTKISLQGGSAYINTAKIIATDIQASNGVIHVIDKVLLP